MQDKILLKNRFAKEVLQFLPCRVKQSLMQTDMNILIGLEEIRLRSEKPAMLHYCGTDGFLHESGRVLDKPSKMIISTEELSDTVYKFCENSGMHIRMTSAKVSSQSKEVIVWHCGYAGN